MGYPLGAKYDKNAPYNSEKKTVSICVSVTFHKDIDVEIEGDYDIVALYHAAEDKLDKDLGPLYKNDWIEDEFEIIKNE